MSLEGVVYNVTTYMSHHPGGKEKLLEGCGKESKNLFGNREITQTKTTRG